MRRARIGFLSGLAALFGFRLAFGLASDFFFEDQTQIYLIGLRYYATGRWPFFGPDVVWTRSEIPGALQGLLVGIPFHVVAAPESPTVLLNLLSFAALCLFAWYLTRVLPTLPRWLVYAWFLTIPWTIQFSTNIINSSYILPATILFFVGFFEATSAFTIGVIHPDVAFAMMGLGMASVMQVHLSWPLLVPYATFAWAARARHGVGVAARDALAFVGGAALPLALLAPTLWRYGLVAGSGGTASNLHIHPVNPFVLFTLLAQFLSFASLEVNRFVATDLPKRIELFEQHLWLIVPAAVVVIAGLVQPFWMLAELLRPSTRQRAVDERARWRALRRLVMASIVLVYVSYFFVTEPPQAHAFYVLSPIALMLAAYCWSRIDSARSRRWVAGLISVSLAYHAGLAVVRIPQFSLYKQRDVVVDAIRTKQPEKLGHRRPFARDAGPYALDASIPHDAQQDVVLSGAAYARRFDGSVHWSMTLDNTSHCVAYRDVLYYTTYRGADGSAIQRHEFIKDIFEPGDARRIELNDGYVRAEFVGASIRVMAAEALMPRGGARCGRSE